MANLNNSREDLFLNGLFFKKYKGDCSLFIETGSYIGDGINAAFEAGFNRIQSIELSESHFQYCKERFKNNPLIEIIAGDSRKILFTVLENNKKCNVFLWLDAHFSGGNTSGEDVSNTLFDELNVIIAHINKFNKIRIAIDDLDTQLWNKISDFLLNYKIEVIEKEIFVGVPDRFIMIFDLSNKDI